MPQFVYRLHRARPGMLADGPTADEERVVGAHFAYLRDPPPWPSTIGLAPRPARDDPAAMRRNVLIVRHDRLGDAVLATPLPREIKRAWPDARVGVLV
ncbi:MAG: glycosyltransferase family 9 protein, partial [Candidatus Krumholzibacteriia bacterium]